MEKQSHTEVVEAPIDVCFDTVVDFVRYPEWFGPISTAVVVKADPSKGLWTVKYGLDMVIKTVRYTLSYRGKRPGELSWTLVDGDVRAVEGTYEFVELEPGLTEATCRQAVDIGFWIPGPIRRTFEKTAVADSVREFKAAAEAAARQRSRA